MKIIEILYSEFGNMYGEVYNAMFLEKSCDNIKVANDNENENDNDNVYSLKDKPIILNYKSNSNITPKCKHWHTYSPIQKIYIFSTISYIQITYIHRLIINFK